MSREPEPDYSWPKWVPEVHPEDEEARAIQRRSFLALAWVAMLVLAGAWLVIEYRTITHTVICTQFVSAPHDAPPPGSCKMRE